MTVNCGVGSQSSGICYKGSYNSRNYGSAVELQLDNRSSLKYGLPLVVMLINFGNMLTQCKTAEQCYLQKRYAFQELCSITF